MLKNVKKSVIMNGQSVIETTEGGVTKEVLVETYTATVDENDLNNITFGRTQMNKALYKANRVQCRADEAEFEETVYAEQERLIAERDAAATE